MADEDLMRRGSAVDCNTCGATGDHNCVLVLLSRSRWLILHYAHRFNETDKLEALPLVEQISGLLTKRARDKPRL